jgi:aryl-alcohol dehydrogenase-like predicted oxidoreductase
VDILHVHGLSVEDYSYAKDTLVPVLEGLRSEGKVRFIGVTEAFAPDPRHQMLKLACDDDLWDVIMVGFNILNQSALETVFPRAKSKNMGVLGMFAVRRALSQPERLREVIGELIEQRLVDETALNSEDPLDFVLRESDAADITDAAYRFCRWEAGIHVVLSGTGDIEHLRQNVRSLSRPPLPEKVITRLREIFRRVDSVSGN